MVLLKTVVIVYFFEYEFFLKLLNHFTDILSFKYVIDVIRINKEIKLK